MGKAKASGGKAGDWSAADRMIGLVRREPEPGEEIEVRVLKARGPAPDEAARARSERERGEIERAAGESSGRRAPRGM